MSKVQVCLEMSMEKLHLPGQAESPPEFLNTLPAALIDSAGDGIYHLGLLC